SADRRAAGSADAARDDRARIRAVGPYPSLLLPRRACRARGTGAAGASRYLERDASPRSDEPRKAGAPAQPRRARVIHELSRQPDRPNGGAQTMIDVGGERNARVLLPKIERLFELSAEKIRSIEQGWNPADGAPVFTVAGRYTARGWTEWTQGFQFGSALLQFDATGERQFLELGRSLTLERMAAHLTHAGAHDHGFNNVSTYGNLWRLARERRFEASDWEERFYALALKVSGAVQARRWTRIPGGGFICSFNGPHSLVVDTIRSLRALSLAHVLGHRVLDG